MSVSFCLQGETETVRRRKRREYVQIKLFKLVCMYPKAPGTLTIDHDHPFHYMGLSFQPRQLSAVVPFLCALIFRALILFQDITEKHCLQMARLSIVFAGSLMGFVPYVDNAAATRVGSGTDEAEFVPAFDTCGRFSIDNDGSTQEPATPASYCKQHHLVVLMGETMICGP